MPAADVRPDQAWVLPEDRAKPKGRLTWEIHSLGDGLSAATRARFEEAMFIAREQLDAVDLLGQPPHRAESIHVLARALTAIEAGMAELRSGLPGEPSPDSVVPPAIAESVRASREQLEAMPRLDVRLSPGDIELWRLTRRRARRLSRQLSAVARPRRAIVMRRALAAALALSLFALILAGWLARAHFRDRFSVSASDFYASDRPPSPFRPEQAVDGDPATEWLAPDDSDGWLQLQFAAPTHVTALHIVNARNAPYDDRGVKELEIELYAGDKLEQRSQVVLEPTEFPGTVQKFPIDGVGVTRIRLTPHSHFGKSAGFAEVSVIEKAP